MLVTEPDHMIMRKTNENKPMQKVLKNLMNAFPELFDKSDLQVFPLFLPHWKLMEILRSCSYFFKKKTNYSFLNFPSS